MAISREKEQAEQAMNGAYDIWQKFNTIKVAYNALTAGQWTTLSNATGLAGVTKAQAVAFIQSREDEAMVELTTAVNAWRLTP